LSKHHFHRLFRRIAGVTPKAYADARRQARARDGLARGTAVTAALYDAGYGSAGRFYGSANAALGMTPSAFRAGGAGEIVRHATGRCALGAVLVAASGRGICAILLGDDSVMLEAELKARFPRAQHQTADTGFASVVAEVIRLVDDPSHAPAPSLPLDVRGTAFQRRVWEALQAIPPGRTLTYAELAAAIGRPTAVRAVAAACGANRLAVAVPCHRVVATGGALAGYRWGIERKRRLLERESGA
jgi:AraC family transcriptional regulator of adaptative response/methylated-DNA-[protein]-cysteine methyltransferase